VWLLLCWQRLSRNVTGRFSTVEEVTLIDFKEIHTCTWFSSVNPHLSGQLQMRILAGSTQDDSGVVCGTVAEMGNERTVWAV